MDNYSMWERHDYEQEKALEELPVCDYCGETIQDDYYYDILGDIVCERCLKREHRRSNG
jgi:formylmethanofuran dehydrogenase subunit E